MEDGLVTLNDLKDVDLTTRLGKIQVQKLIKRILTESTSLIAFTSHARKEMASDSMDALDVLNVLRAGHVFEDGEFENGSWRFRVHTERFCVVVAFRNPHQLVVVTAWRK
jgi:hypothetical protein